MSADSDKLVPANYFLEPGYIFLAARPTVISVVLGSCVSVCMYDRKRKVGGMNHFRRPVVRDRRRATAVYGNVATLALVRMMLNDGSKKKHLEAQVFGGAHNAEVSSRNIGRENIHIAKRILARERIPVVSEDVGGSRGRKIVFNTAKNEIAVIRVERLRTCDWFPYEGDR